MYTYILKHDITSAGNHPRGVSRMIKYGGTNHNGNLPVDIQKSEFCFFFGRFLDFCGQKLQTCPCLSNPPRHHRLVLPRI